MKIKITEGKLRAIINEAVRTALNEGRTESLIVPELENAPDENPGGYNPMPKEIAKKIAEYYENEICNTVEEVAKEEYWDRNPYGGDDYWSGTTQYEDDTVLIEIGYDCSANGYYWSGDYWHPEESDESVDGDCWVDSIIYGNDEGAAFRCDDVDFGAKF